MNFDKVVTWAVYYESLVAGEFGKTRLSPQVMSPCNEDDLARAFYHFEGEPGGPVFPNSVFADSVAPPAD
jgi:hypothetical protein